MTPKTDYELMQHEINVLRESLDLQKAETERLRKLLIESRDCHLRTLEGLGKIHTHYMQAIEDLKIN